MRTHKNSEKSERFFSEARKNHKLGNFDKAFNLYNESLKINPLNAEAYYYLAHLYVRRGDNKHAIDFYTKSISLDSKFADAFASRGNAFHKQGQLDKALDDYTNALNLEKDNPKLLTNKANILRDSAMYTEALRLYDVAIAIDQKLPEIFLNQGITFEKLTLYPSAINSYTRALDLRPDYYEALLRKAVVLNFLTEYRQSLALLSVAEQLRATEAALFLIRGHAYSGLGQYDEALTSYKRCFFLDSNSIYARHYAGSILIKTSRYEEAYRVYSDAIKINSSVLELYVNRGVALAGMKRYGEALEDYNWVISRQPNYLEVIQNKANIYIELNQFAKALACLDDVLTLDPNRATALYTRTILKAKIGLFAGVFRDAERVVTLPNLTKEQQDSIKYYYFHSKAFSTLENKVSPDFLRSSFIEPTDFELHREKDLEIVTFYVPASDVDPFSKKKNITIWDFFLKEFFRRAKIHSPNSKIILLTSEEAALPDDLPEYTVLRSSIDTKNLMYARLLAQIRYLETRGSSTASLILDLDVIINRFPTDFLTSKSDIILTVRYDLPSINAGVVFVGPGKTPKAFFQSVRWFYDRLIELAANNPAISKINFKNWWGDQIAMCAAANLWHSGTLAKEQYEHNKISFSLKNCDLYNYGVGAHDNNDLEDLRCKYFLHFKGHLSERITEVITRSL